MLEFKNVSTYYGKIQALHDVSLHINQGEIVTLIGANGAGKTTLLMTLCGDPKPQSGQVLFEGQDITQWHTAKIMRGDIAIVPEGRRIFSRLTVEENLSMGAFFVDKAEQADLLAEVYELFPRLKERLTQRAGTMSGGEQQMLAIGRALMTNPSLLLLDEPMEGLAPIIVEELSRAIRRLSLQEGLPSIVVEQHPVLALSMTDQVIVLERGTVVHAGDSAALAADPARLARWLGVQRAAA